VIFLLCIAPPTIWEEIRGEETASNAEAQSRPPSPSTLVLAEIGHAELEKCHHHAMPMPCRTMLVCYATGKEEEYPVKQDGVNKECA
jgi:hypothetical protein